MNITYYTYIYDGRIEHGNDMSVKTAENLQSKKIQKNYVDCMHFDVKQCFLQTKKKTGNHNHDVYM